MFDKDTFTFCNFNSIKVRLERDADAGADGAVVPFQFHKGTIRTAYLPKTRKGCVISIP